MPVLDWIGKKAVVNHHRSVPYRILQCDADRSGGSGDSGNLLVQGDNLEALKALLPYYAGSVKAAYIDPPYNTGNKEAEKNAWFYNDNVDSLEIREWLGKVVGAEGEDFSRHDKWLCMMYPRLKLLRELLYQPSEPSTLTFPVMARLDRAIARGTVLKRMARSRRAMTVGDNAMG